MILLFEEYHYSQTILEEILEGLPIPTSTLRNNQAKVQCVGYFYSKSKEDSVFILPKVFIKSANKINVENEVDEILAFGRYKPEDIVFIDVDKSKKDNTQVLSKVDREFIFELAVWIYRAIAQFASRKSEENIIDNIVIQNPISANGEKSQTLLDTILQLVDFNKNHRSLFTYIAIINSSGNNKIHWAKTISKTQPIIKENTPYYTEFKNKNKVFNFDEELIVLFYSTLEYLCDKYNFRVQQNVQYRLIPPHKIESFIKYGGGTRLLKRIRRKYFTDELVKLWKLLYAFYDRAEEIESHKHHEDKLLVKNFNLVFEDMIDYLIGSKIGNEIPKYIKDQTDGKRVDHIYKAKSLIDNDDIYYVGDSKYYFDNSEASKQAKYKQFTYAKNIIQFNINLLNGWSPQENGSKRDAVLYRDDITEGYDITPNFFIRGDVDCANLSSLSYDKMNLTSTKDKDGNDTVFINRHFYNRLFDRDTLILKEYNINFLFVLSAYVLHIESTSRREQIRAMFRDDLIKALNERYQFYQIEPQNKGRIEELVEHNFRRFMGRMYVGNDITNKKALWVALEKEAYKENIKDNDNAFVYPSIDIDFIGDIKVKETTLKADGVHNITKEYTQCVGIRQLNYIYPIDTYESEKLGHVADIEVKYNE